MNKEIEDLREEIEALNGYKHMYGKLIKQNKRYRELIEEIHFQASLVETSDNVYNAIIKALEEEK